MKIMQANLHRSKIADNLLAQLTLELEVDLLLISEQYKNTNKPGWYSDKLGTAAIYTTENNKSPVRSYASYKGFVSVQVGNVTYFSCYFTPNESMQEFQAKLDILEDAIRENVGPLVVAGDFNSKAVEWGMPNTDSRGKKILEMACRTNLSIANAGNTPTFRRAGCRGTIPDITLVSDNLEGEVIDWKVIEEYTGSDHQYITFHIKKNEKRAETLTQVKKWNVGKLNEEVLECLLDTITNKPTKQQISAETTAVDTMQFIRDACDASMPRHSKRSKHKAAYWWTEEIAMLRKVCLQNRRKYTRTRRRSGEAFPSEPEEYKQAKKRLRLAINHSKQRCWDTMIQDINKDPWGLGYRIVMGKLGKQGSQKLNVREMNSIVGTLFPTHPEIIDSEHKEVIEDIPVFTSNELEHACNQMANKRATGPDGIPTEVLKFIVRRKPNILLDMFNTCLNEGVFPKIWKQQRLVLINKGKGDPTQPSSYRPLCMLNTTGKLYERLLKPRLTAAIERAGGLSKHQHGFRKGRSTIGAIDEVVNAIKKSQSHNQYSKKVVLLATLDIRNAFNSAKWAEILTALKDYFKIPEYLLRVMKSYLSDRELLYDTTEGLVSRKITAGAAQGSILGPDLWNISYDEILRLEMPEDTFLVGYADDLAAVMTARNVEQAQWKLNQVMRRIHSWLDAHGLNLATEKAELILFTSRRIPLELPMQINTETFTTKQSVKYLGLHIDNRLNYWAQIKKVSNRAAEVTTRLSRLMANVRGPIYSKRRVLMSVSDNIMLYGSEMWAHVLRKDNYRKCLASVQRKGALRVASAYRTVSEAAVLVIAGSIPIDLLALERQHLYNMNKVGGDARSEQERKLEARRQTVQEWQNRWSREKNGRWTAKLIGNVENWLNRKHGEINYYTTQFLTGHGYFQTYLHHIGKRGSAACQYGDASRDDAEHTFFACVRWLEDRRTLETKIGSITPETVINAMLRNEENWHIIASYVEEIIRKKKPEMDQSDT